MATGPVLYLGTSDPGDLDRANQAADALTLTCQKVIPQVGIKGILDGLMSLYVTLSVQTLGEAGTRAALQDTSAQLPRLTALMRAQEPAPPLSRGRDSGSNRGQDPKPAPGSEPGGSPPGYWMNETSGRLRPAVMAFLNGAELGVDQIALLRAYCRQWIMADVWDMNPHMGAEEKVWLAELRADLDTLTTRAAISSWLDRATEGGLDPL
jgi:hypothetical protein